MTGTRHPFLLLRLAPALALAVLLSACGADGEPEQPTRADAGQTALLLPTNVETAR